MLDKKSLRNAIITEIFAKNVFSFEEVKITLEQGKPLFIIGANDAGKTNIIRIIDLFMHLSRTEGENKFLTSDCFFNVDNQIQTPIRIELTCDASEYIKSIFTTRTSSILASMWLISYQRLVADYLAEQSRESMGESGCDEVMEKILNLEDPLTDENEYQVGAFLDSLSMLFTVCNDIVESFWNDRVTKHKKTFLLKSIIHAEMQGESVHTDFSVEIYADNLLLEDLFEQFLTSIHFVEMNFGNFINDGLHIFACATYNPENDKVQGKSIKPLAYKDKARLYEIVSYKEEAKRCAMFIADSIICMHRDEGLLDITSILLQTEVIEEPQRIKYIRQLVSTDNVSSLGLLPIDNSSVILPQVIQTVLRDTELLKRVNLRAQCFGYIYTPKTGTLACKSKTGVERSLFHSSESGRHVLMLSYVLERAQSVGNVFIDEPGSMLHPSAQHTVRSQLALLAKDRTVTVVTHSAALIHLNMLNFSYLRVFHKNGRSFTHIPSDTTGFNPLSATEKYTFRAILFSKLAILVEGKDDQEVFLRQQQNNPDSELHNSVLIAPLSGSSTPKTMLFCEAFQVPYVAVGDIDTIDGVSRKLVGGGTKQSVEETLKKFYENAAIKAKQIRDNTEEKNNARYQNELLKLFKMPNNIEPIERKKFKEGLTKVIVDNLPDLEVTNHQVQKCVLAVREYLKKEVALFLWPSGAIEDLLKNSSKGEHESKGSTGLSEEGEKYMQELWEFIATRLQ